MTIADDSEQKARLERMIRDDYRFIWRLLRRLGVSPELADDATQQVFLVAAERMADIKPRSERAFAFGTALRVAQTLRRRGQREASLVDADVRASVQPQPDELAERQRVRELADRVLDRMPLELRTVFVLFELEGLSSPEIAQLHELPLGTVASRLRRARERFRALVESELRPSAAPPPRGAKGGPS